MPADIHAVMQDAQHVDLVVDNRPVQEQMPSRPAATRDVQDPEVRMCFPDRPSARHVGPRLECGRSSQDGCSISHGLSVTEIFGGPIDNLRKVAQRRLRKGDAPDAQPHVLPPLAYRPLRRAMIGSVAATT